MDNLDYKKMCRLCLSKDCTLTKIFSENDSAPFTDSLSQLIIDCVGIEVEPGENLPDKICNVCIDELKRWQRFKKLCELSNEELITGMPPLPDEVLEKNLQSKSDNLETSSDFGLGDVSLLEHDSLFNSIDGFKDGNIVGNDLITSKPFSSLNNNCENIGNWNKREEQLENEAEDTVLRENKRSKWREKYSRIYLKKYNCELCSNVFSKFSQLLQHDRVDHKDTDKTVACDKCGKLFISKHRLETHHRMKHGDKIYECDICGLKSVSEKSLKVHKTRHSKRFICDVCGLVTNSNRSLQDHKLAHMDAQSRPVYVCDICHRTFKNKQWFDTHMLTHTTDKTEWKCKECDKEFKNLQSFNRHKSAHSDEKTAVCEECGAVLKNKMTLYIHKLKHKEKQHMCQLCDKLFQTKNLLNRHMTVHLNPSHRCSICNRVFSRNDILKKHLKTHHKTIASQ
ncbi:zinc finger protein 90-like [Macrosteles quadrilineatus]|uniref:zinc finger protein 90-like n=1 Tax=Macrosteles quadrilineatus TaxID=74068 RepID=UPI0023E20665|nr:zinc finger protein 90-like [Macrosteles quadrilineatus]